MLQQAAAHKAGVAFAEQHVRVQGRCHAWQASCSPLVARWWQQAAASMPGQAGAVQACAG